MLWSMPNDASDVPIYQSFSYNDSISNNSNIYFAEIGDAPLQNFDKASMCLVQLVLLLKATELNNVITSFLTLVTSAI